MPKFGFAQLARVKTFPIIIFPTSTSAYSIPSPPLDLSKSFMSDDLFPFFSLSYTSFIKWHSILFVNALFYKIQIIMYYMCNIYHANFMYSSTIRYHMSCYIIIHVQYHFSLTWHVKHFTLDLNVDRSMFCLYSFYVIMLCSLVIKAYLQICY